MYPVFSDFFRKVLSVDGYLTNRLNVPAELRPVTPADYKLLSDKSTVNTHVFLNGYLG